MRYFSVEKMMSLCVVTSVEKSERLCYLVKGLHMLQCQCIAPCATPWWC